MAYSEKVPDWKAPGTEPPESLKNEGWKPGQKPPADYFNWFMTLVSKALAELQAESAEKIDLLAHIADAVKHITAAERTAWNAKETPAGAQQKVDAHANDTVKHITAAERTAWNAKETPSGAQSKVDTHAGLTNGVHGATSAATANRIVQRDANGRINIADPSSASHAATKNYVDTVVNSNRPYVWGGYTGDGVSSGKTINVGFNPAAVIVFPGGMSFDQQNYTFTNSGMAAADNVGGNLVKTSSGFTVKGAMNLNAQPYNYIAFKK